MKQKKVVEVAYICNGKNQDCKGKDSCYYQNSGRHGGCLHTMNTRYAKNKPVDPKKHPDRFDKFNSGDVVRYYEKYGLN